MRIEIYLDKELKNKLDQRAKKLKLSRSRLIRTHINECLNPS